jgi:hypothetical protein
LRSTTRHSTLSAKASEAVDVAALERAAKRGRVEGHRALTRFSRLAGLLESFMGAPSHATVIGS